MAHTAPEITVDQIEAILDDVNAARTELSHLFPDQEGEDPVFAARDYLDNARDNLETLRTAPAVAAKNTQ